MPACLPDTAATVSAKAAHGGAQAVVSTTAQLDGTESGLRTVHDVLAKFHIADAPMALMADGACASHPLCSQS